MTIDDATLATAPDPARELAAAGIELTDAGLSPGSSGNASVRIGTEMWISPSGVRLGQLDPAAMSRISLDESSWGEHLGGPTPSKEVPLHLAMYQREASTTCVVHLHSPACVALACLPPWTATNALAPLTPYPVMRLGQVPLIAYAPPGDPRQAQDVAEWDRPFRAALLGNHGSLVAGEEVRTAVERTLELEDAARLDVTTRHLPDRVLLDTDQIAELVHRYRSPWTF
ncbi:class II aldolase/adducin family protein [Ruania halotolerans]|uniref:class II aldolase/adducin family protein n=1 Tax=Ruania halotolerans TaxID=2897773 RepID=UPI001E58EFA6|nr:class II aldolase/adducin family protein [Ruania halotolerans]UFU06092.1 class II aldolase/adducin family protein [Ruania halotolerans]